MRILRIKTVRLHLLLVFILFAIFESQGQGVGINTTVIHPSAILEIKSTNKGVLFPSVTEKEKYAIRNASIGLMVYDIDLKALFYWDGRSWGEVGSSDPDWYIFGLDSMYSHFFNMLVTSEGIGIGGAPDSNTILNIESTDKGFLLPRLSLSQRNNIVNPATGLIVYQKDARRGLYYYTGVRWELFGVSASIDWVLYGGDTIYSFDSTMAIYNRHIMVGDVFENGNLNIEPTAIFNVNHNSKGFVFPRVTKLTRNSMANPTEGLLMYQIDDTVGMYYYGNNKWNYVNTLEKTWRKDVGVIYSWIDSTVTIKKGKFVGIDQINPNSSSILDINSNDKGILIPRITTSSKLGIQNPADGLLVFDIDTKSFWYYRQNNWIELVNTKGNIVIPAEYEGAIIKNSGSNSIGEMTIGNSNATLWMNYYQWLSNQNNVNSYNIYLSVIVPEDFNTWDTLKTVELDIQTFDNLSNDNAVSVNIYVVGSSSSRLVASKLNIASPTWDKIIFKDTDFSIVPNPGEKLIIEIKLQSSQGKFARVGDFSLNYIK